MQPQENPPVNQFAYGLKLLQNEFEIEDSVERTTDGLLAESQLGERAPRLYEELGTALSLFVQMACCQWGCRGKEHREENLLRRLANYSFGALRLARLGLYNESISMLRSVAELANLIELFTINRDHFNDWHGTPAAERWKSYGPAKVREKIESTGNRPVIDKDTYAALYNVGVHVSPESAKLSHQFDGKVSAGGEFSPMAFLLVLNELALMLSACLKLSGNFIEANTDRLQLLMDAGARLESNATAWLRITNYEQRIREVGKDGENRTDT
jgi:hypothetical protein